MLRTTAMTFIALSLIGLIGCRTERDREVEVKQMYTDYIATWSTHDVEKMATYFTDDCVYENLAREQVYRGKNEVKEWARMSFVAIPDFKLEVTSLFVSGNWLACEWVMTGTHTGNAPDFPATGKSFSVRGSAIAEVIDGKIKREAIYWGTATFLRQLGLMK